MDSVKILRNDYHVVVRSHVAQQTEEAALVEFDVLFGERTFVLHGQGREPLFNKHIARNAYDVLFDECISVNKEIDAVRRQELFQFQSIDSGRIAFLDVEENVVVVDDVPDFHPERLGVAKGAKRDAVHRDERQDGVAAIGMQDGVKAFEIEDEFVTFGGTVHTIDPQRIVVIAIQNRDAALKTQEVVVRYWNFDRSAVRVEVTL